MVKQMTLATAKEFEIHGSATRKAEFLARIERLAPWAGMCGLMRGRIAPGSATAERRSGGYLIRSFLMKRIV